MKLPTGVIILTSMCLSLACGDDGSAEGSSGSTDTDPTTATTTPTPPTTMTTTGEPSTGEPTTETTTSVDTTADSTTETTGEPVDIDVELQFAVRVGDMDAVCGQSYDDIGTAGSTIEFLDIRFFVSNIRLVDDGDDEVPLAMEDDAEWQLGGTALLDFEDGSGGCSENTTAETNTTVRGTVPDGTYTGVRFDLGLPFEQNHLNADEADPPLNTTAMFWNWAAGYKFVKIDIQNDNMPPDNRWNFHLGSQACDNGMAGPTVPPDQECARPGRPAIDLSGFDPVTGTIVLDTAVLYAGEDVSADTPMSAPGCMSFMPDINECDDLFPTLGMDWMSGDCVDGCSGQTVFRGE